MEDRTATGGWTPGGPSLYSAVAAARLGAEVTLFTRLTARYDRTVLAGLDVRALPAATVPRYANSYDTSGHRTQLLLDEGEPLELAGFDTSGFDATMAAPAFHELRSRPAAHGLFAVALQGALRRRNADDTITSHQAPLQQSGPFLAADYVCLSREDAPHVDSFACELSRLGPAVIVTDGADGARLVREGKPTVIAPAPATQVDPTGAGDCFFAAFVVRLLETGDECEAGRFAAAAGALAVEGSGIRAIPTRSMVEARLREVAA